jgi:inner membrane protein involved in colicin E2 resistance
MSGAAPRATQARAGYRPASCTEFVGLAHGVTLYQPADIYQQLERSAKYGFLFIGLTFVAFFLFEILKQLAIHPIQYGLVGVALATFYLLLVVGAGQLWAGLCNGQPCLHRPRRLLRLPRAA